jgi:hypothetical protein
MSELDACHWSASRSSRFIPRDTVPTIGFTGRWITFGVGLDAAYLFIYLFICGLFNDHVSSLEYIATNDRINENVPAISIDNDAAGIFSVTL